MLIQVGLFIPANMIIGHARGAQDKRVFWAFSIPQRPHSTASLG
jgi:hypothetical protein